MTVHQQWVNALLTPGTEGADVVRAMQRHYADGKRTLSGPGTRPYNPCTLRTKVSEVTRMFLEATPQGRQRNTHPDYHDGLLALRQAASGASADCRAAVREFEALSLREQVKLSRPRRGGGGGRMPPLYDRLCASAVVRKAFEQLKIVPDELASFNIGSVDHETCKHHGAARLLGKPKSVIPSAHGLLQQARAALERAVAAKSDKDVDSAATICALLLVSGRRTSELLRRPSDAKWKTFMPWKAHSHGVLFRGQLKAQRHVHELAYPIPLLVESDLFLGAYDRLRKWQLQRYGDERGMSNAQVSRRYQPSLSRFLAKRPFGDDVMLSAHKLRAVYMAYVLLLYDWGPHRDKRVAKYCLGHAQSSTSDHYDHIHFMETGGLRSIGVFPITEEMLQTTEAYVGSK